MQPDWMHEVVTYGDGRVVTLDRTKCKGPLQAWHWRQIMAAAPLGPEPCPSTAVKRWQCSRCGVVVMDPVPWKVHQTFCLAVKPAKTYPLELIELGDEGEWVISLGHHDAHVFLNALCRFYSEAMGHAYVRESLGLDDGESVNTKVPDVKYLWGRWCPAQFGDRSDCDYWLQIADHPGPGAFPITHLLVH